MSTSHPCRLTEAFDTIHDEVRKLQRENNELRMKNNQAAAALEICARERDDALRQSRNLQNALARKFGTQADGGVAA